MSRNNPFFFCLPWFFRESQGFSQVPVTIQEGKHLRIAGLSFLTSANLALFFAYHVLWPSGFEGKFDWVSLAIGILAFMALFKFKIDIVKVILACAIFGWLSSLLT